MKLVQIKVVDEEPAVSMFKSFSDKPKVILMDKPFLIDSLIDDIKKAFESYYTLGSN
ncbi:MAG: hypothetical protein ACTSV5_01535 [Promethearchaeota archaeon]